MMRFKFTVPRGNIRKNGTGTIFTHISNAFAVRMEQYTDEQREQAEAKKLREELMDAIRSYYAEEEEMSGAALIS